MAVNVDLYNDRPTNLELVIDEKIEQGGIRPSGTLDITANGEYDVTMYAEADVNLPNVYTAEDIDKVVGDGELVPQTERTVTQNGVYDTTYNDETTVNVPNTYTEADEGKVVQEGELVGQTDRNITVNGDYDTTTNDFVSVDVPNTYTSEDEDKVVQNGQLVTQTPTRIDANGSYDTTTNDIVAVAVPNTYTAQDEGKVVDDGALVQQTSRNIAQNDTYDTTLNNEVVVDVPNSYSATDEGKVVSNGALVQQTALEVTENGTFDTTLNNEVTVDVEPPDWVRPSEWPNLDLLHDDDYAVYMTVDNTSSPIRIAVYARSEDRRGAKAERVTINSDGSITVHETITNEAIETGFDITVPVNAGDYPCYRFSGLNGANLTQFAMQGNNFDKQMVKERWVNLPYCTELSFNGFAARGWKNNHVEQDTFLNLNPNHGSVTLNGQGHSTKSLRSIRVFGDVKLKLNAVGLNVSTLLKGLSPDEISLAITSDLINRFVGGFSYTQIDLSELLTITSLASTFYNCHNLKEVTFNQGADLSSVTINNTFRDCFSLTEVIIPKSFVGQITNNAFAGCYSLKRIVLPSEVLLSLGSTNSLESIVTAWGTVKVYVRQSLIEDYKVATNWSTLYNTNNDFLQPIEGSEFEYLLEE